MCVVPAGWHVAGQAGGQAAAGATEGHSVTLVPLPPGVWVYDVQGLLCCEPNMQAGLPVILGLLAVDTRLHLICYQAAF